MTASVYVHWLNNVRMLILSGREFSGISKLTFSWIARSFSPCHIESSIKLKK